MAAADMERGSLGEEGEAGVINKYPLMFDTDDPKFNPTYRFGKCYPLCRSTLTAEIYPLAGFAEALSTTEERKNTGRGQFQGGKSHV